MKSTLKDVARPPMLGSARRRFRPLRKMAYSPAIVAKPAAVRACAALASITPCQLP